MPNHDGTGPMGMGPMTGRAAGFCAGYSVPRHLNLGGGRIGDGWRGNGGGRGRRNSFYATGRPGWARGSAPYAPAAAAGPTPEQKLEWLKRQAARCEQALEDIRKRITELTTSES